MRSQTGVVAVGLGSAQLIAWGTLYYAIAVLGEPMGAELNASHSAVFGTFTGALAISGLLAKWAGSTIDRYGGRAVLVASVLIGAAAFGVLGHAGSTGELAVGWSLAGLAPGTFYSLYARSSDGEKTRCSIALRLLTPRDDNTLEAPVIDAFTERIESPARVTGTTVEGLLAVYRNGTALPDFVAPLASGEFLVNVPLVKGLNRIEIRAVNPYSGEQSPPSNTLELRVGR